MEPRRTLPGILAAALALGAITACSTPVWNPGLAERFPDLAAHPGHHLADLHPYVLPLAGELWLFTCRWTTEAPIGVWISEAFEDDERVAIREALRVWQGAGLGVRFGEVLRDEASLHIERSEEPLGGAGLTVADCAVDLDVEPSASWLGAELVSARIVLASSEVSDAIGRPSRLDADEQLGAALHELGHALGFQGHVTSGESVLNRAPERVRALGARVREGDALRDPSLSALYALPSGSVLDRRSVPAWRTDLVDRMARLATRAGLVGPFARVGDTAARVFWRAETGRRDEYGLAVVNLSETYARPERVLVLAEPLARSALPRSRDRRPTR